MEWFEAAKQKLAERVFNSTEAVEAPIEDDVEVWLPMRPYRLKLKHRILSELGELSHYILSTMYEYDFDLSSIYKTTGLTTQQLDPVIRRLKGLGFIELNSGDESNGFLKDEGKQVASYLSIGIHNYELDVHIDQNYGSRNKKWFICKSTDSVLSDIPDDGIKIPLPKRTSRDFNEDRFLQAQRLSSYASQKISTLIPEYNHIFDESDDPWGKEWEFTLSKSEGYLVKGIRALIPLKKFEITQNNKVNDKYPDKTLKLYTPVLKLTTTFSVPLGVLWEEVDA